VNLDSSETSCQISSYSALIPLLYEPCGRWFEACLKRQRSERSVSVVEETDGGTEEVEVDDAEITDDEKTFILSLASSEWKKQDHYRVLGLSHLRSLATDADIKTAYRKKVLKHHPDKKAANQTPIPGLNEQDYFTCITKAYETLSTVEGRRAFDSVDETFNDNIPTSFNSTKQDFFKIFGPSFLGNSRWSNVKPVPQLGSMESTLDEVNAFYSFWYEFDSWREFSYLDEEEKERAENREERRWMEQQNRKMRQKRKKDEIQRIRTLVDTAYTHDPRLKKYKEEKKRKKEEEKRLKEEAAKEKERQRLQVLEEERKQQEKLEQDAKEKAQKEKKEKDKIKKAIAKDRKTIRQFVKDNNYFTSEKEDIALMDRLEKTLENLSHERIQELKEITNKENIEKFKTMYTQYSDDVLETLKKKLEEKQKALDAAQNKSSKQSNQSANQSDQHWTEQEVQLLVKATTLFAIGTASRWDVIAEYINEHSDSTKKKTGKHVISKVKKLQKLDPSVKEDMNKRAFENLSQTTSNKLANKPVASDISVNDKLGKAEEAPPADKTWSSDEQKLLEQALKKFGSSEAERWEKIAAHVKTRNKKECMKRYKELVEMVKAKKAAAAAKTS